MIRRHVHVTGLRIILYMKPELCREIMACLPAGRTLFRYGKDHYAFHLLRRAAGDGSTVSALRKSAVAPLLEKPLVRAWLAGLGGGFIRACDVPESEWMPDTETYRLSLGIWGEHLDAWKYNQVSRRGASLVLHLNHSNRQYLRLKRVLAKNDEDPFIAYSHPEAGGRFPTLAWARLDIDLERREALIEELQTDRIRDVILAVGRARAPGAGDTIRCWGADMNREALLRYWDTEMKRHAAIWDEAMLTAALNFLHREIGVRKIFLHTHESGGILKRIRRKQPPRSLYTTLPRRFCFELSGEVPGMLTDCASWANRSKHQRGQMRFHVLDL